MIAGKKSSLLLLCGVFIALAGMLFAGILVRPFTLDEQNHYVPVILYFYDALPSMPLTGYAFPAPPLGAYLQALFFSLAGENLYMVRLMSFMAFLFLGLTVFAKARRGSEITFALLFTLALLCYPFLLIHAFSLRQHCIALLFLTLSMLVRTEGESPRWWHAIIENVLLCAAVLVHQLALVYPLSLFLLRILRYRYSDEKIGFNVATWFMLLPLGAMLFFVLLWGGTTPPAYQAVAYGVYGESSAVVTFRMKQLVLLFLSVGVWFSPLLRFSTIRLIPYVCTYIVAFGLIYLSGGYSPQNTFVQSIVGPVSSFARLIGGGSEPITTAIISIPVSLGMRIIIQLATELGYLSHFLIYTLIYFIFMCAVPSYFESYFLYYAVVSYLILYNYMHTEHARKCQYFFSICILLGFVYTNITLFYRR